MAKDVKGVLKECPGRDARVCVDIQEMELLVGQVMVEIGTLKA